MGLLVKVKVSHYVTILTDEMDVDNAFDQAETAAVADAEVNGLENVEVEDMEIIGSIDDADTDEDAVYEERRTMQIGIVA